MQDIARRDAKPTMRQCAKRQQGQCEAKDSEKSITQEPTSGFIRTIRSLVVSLFHMFIYSSGEKHIKEQVCLKDHCSMSKKRRCAVEPLTNQDRGLLRALFLRCSFSTFGGTRPRIVCCRAALMSSMASLVLLAALSRSRDQCSDMACIGGSLL